MGRPRMRLEAGNRRLDRDVRGDMSVIEEVEAKEEKAVAVDCAILKEMPLGKVLFLLLRGELGQQLEDALLTLA